MDESERYRRALAYAGALRWRDAAVELAPVLPGTTNGVYLALGAEIALALGAYAEACHLARLAVVPGANFPGGAFLRFARLLRRLELPAELEAALASRPDGDMPAHARAEIALLASSAGLYEHAANVVAGLLRDAPRFADAHYLDGMLHMFAGRRAASLDSLARALALEPRMGNAHWLVAMQADASTADAHVLAMRRALTGIVPGSEAEAYVRFSLHRRLHSLERYAEAWDELTLAMRVARSLAPYDASREHRLFEVVSRVELPPFEPAPRPAGDPSLIFIVGMFRSGTSLIERVLTGHPEVMDGGETFQLTAALREAADYECHGALDDRLAGLSPRLDFALVRERVYRYARWRARGKSFLTEKLPSNFLNVGLIAHAFPEARIVHLRRSPIATCFSNLRTYFRGAADYSNSIADFCDYYAHYARLMSHWHRVVPSRVLDVAYEQFVADPEGESRRLLEFCGVPFDAGILEVSREAGHTATASAADVRSGIQTGRDREWEPYRFQLGPAIAGLGGVD